MALLGSAGAPVAVYFGSSGLATFQNLLFGSGNHNYLTVSGTGSFGMMISAFDSPSEKITLLNIGNNGYISHVDTVNDRVTVTGSLGSKTLQFNSIDGMSFTTAPDAGGGTDLIACFRRGTLIRTEEGDVPVEALAIGDRVVTASGAARPIKWIGRRSYDPPFFAGNDKVLPIRIEKGALGDGMPGRDLYVSPEHAMVVDGRFLPARTLVNGVTIRQVECTERLEYFHLELESHDGSSPRVRRPRASSILAGAACSTTRPSSLCSIPMLPRPCGRITRRC